MTNKLTNPPSPHTMEEVLREILAIAERDGQPMIALLATGGLAIAKKKTARIVLDDLKDPDGWHELMHALGIVNVDDDGNDLSTPAQKELQEHLRWGEYASVELVVDEDLNIVGGKIL